MRRGVDYLLEEQEEDGSWFGRWGVNYIYGAGAVLPALEAVGFGPDHPAVRRAIGLARAAPERGRRLRRGLPLLRPGRGGAERGAAAASPRPRRRPGRSSASSPAARRARSAPPARPPGSATTQRADGDWDEDYFTGTGFPRDFLINYHLYRTVWPVMALGRYRAALAS